MIAATLSPRDDSRRPALEVRAHDGALVSRVNEDQGALLIRHGAAEWRGRGSERYLLLRTDALLSAHSWQGGSHTTRRMKDVDGVIFSAPLIREHKPIF